MDRGRCRRASPPLRRRGPNACDPLGAPRLEPIRERAAHMIEWDQGKFEREILEQVKRVSAPNRGRAAEAGRRNGKGGRQPPPVRRDERTADQKPLSAETLMTLTFSPIKYVVPGIIVEGLTLLAGKPKLGKSWLLLHMAIAVA